MDKPEPFDEMIESILSKKKLISGQEFNKPGSIYVVTLEDIINATNEFVLKTMDEK